MALDHDNLIDRLASQIQENQHKTEEESYELAKGILLKRGHIDEDGNLTDSGLERQLLGAEGRALDRHINRYGGKSIDYEYDYDSNKVRKRK